jgi:hypothetical protein
MIGMPLVLCACAVALASASPTPTPPRLRTSLYARAYQITVDGASSDAFGYLHAEYDLSRMGLSAGGSYQFSNDKLLESYVAYDHDRLHVKAGDQFFASPWADTHLVWGLKPTAFQGIDAQYSISGWVFEVADMLRFQSRNARTFSRTTLLTNASNQTGGFTYGRMSFASPHSPLAFNAYGYRIGDLADMAWFTARADFSKNGWAPYLRAQMGVEHDVGSSKIGLLNSSIEGMLVGANPLRNLNVEAAFDVSRGAWLSPYGDSYASDPLYTTPLLDGMIDRHRAGSSSYLDATYQANDKHASVLGFAGWYDGIRELDAVAIYRWKHSLARVGYAEEIQPLKASRHLFLQLEYSSTGRL